MAIDVTAPERSQAQPQASDEGPVGPRSTRWRARLLRRPVLTVFVVALALRVALAVVSYAAVDGFLVPDELQYVQLAATVADGQSAEDWTPGYGQSLYDSTYAFTMPMRVVMEVLPHTRLPGSLYEGVLGALAAACTAALALRVVSRRWALAAGLIVAAMPSQVYWSSAAIREGSVWIALALCGLLLARSKGRSALQAAACILAAGLALLTVGWLRDQTLVVAAWAFAVWGVFAGRRLWRVRVPMAVVVAVLVPLIAGVGFGGVKLVERFFPYLGATRAYQSMDAQSGFTPTTLYTDTTTTTTIPPTTTVLPGTETTQPGSSPGGGPGRPTTTTTTTAPPAPTTTAPAVVPSVDADGNPVSIIRTTTGEIVVANETFDASLSQLPDGLVNTLLRPFPWESAHSTGLLLAKIENVLWYGLYGLAALGIVVGRRRFWELGWPALVVVFVVGTAAVTQGNLGTAFRHRGQVLWALAVLAAVGAEHLWTRHAERRAVRVSLEPLA